MSSDLINKMLQWEESPPKEAWERITAALDTDDEYLLSQKLSSFQSQPPMHVWNKIEQELNAHKPGRVISFFQQHRKAFKYSSAAAALIFLAVLISLLLTKKTVSNELRQQSTLHNFQQQETKSSTSLENANAKVNSLNDSQISSSTSLKEIYSGQNNSANAKISSVKPLHNKTNSRYYDAIISEWKQTKDSFVSRYFVQTNKSGEAVRFSSKLYDLFQCSDDWTEAECAQQIKLWQQKAATSSMYASADFTGVLEVIKGMQEN